MDSKKKCLCIYKNTLTTGRAVSRIFFSGKRGQMDFFFGEGGYEKTSKNAQKICLCSILLRFYELVKLFFGRGGVKPPIPQDRALPVGATCR